MGFTDLITTQECLFSLVGALLGIATHHGIFIHSEWYNQAPNILRSYAGIFGCVAMYRIFVSNSEATGRLASGLLIASSCHVLGLLVSILVYRGLFHRLNNAKFPGPWWARYTKVWQIWENRDSKNHLYLHNLNQKYGDVVRTGEIYPNPEEHLAQNTGLINSF